MGPLPRPWGGVAVHVRRLWERLLKEGFRVRLWDERLLRGRWAERALLAPEPVIHYHGHSWGARARLAWATFLGKRVVFTVHSLRREPPPRIALRYEFRLALKRAFFIASSDEVSEKLKRLGAERVFTVPTYLKPAERPEPAPEVAEFAKSHEPVLLTAAFNARPGKRQRDFYGVLDALDAARILRQDFPKLGLIVYLARPGPLFPEVKKRLERWVLLRLNAPEPSWSALSVAQLFIRATESDTTAISLLEAADAGVPAVASDAVPRPGWVRVYEAGNPRGLAAAVKEALLNPSLPPKPKDYFEDVLKVYSLAEAQ